MVLRYDPKRPYDVGKGAATNEEEKTAEVRSTAGRSGRAATKGRKRATAEEGTQISPTNSADRYSDKVVIRVNAPSRQAGNAGILVSSMFFRKRKRGPSSPGADEDYRVLLFSASGWSGGDAMERNEAPLENGTRPVGGKARMKISRNRLRHRWDPHRGVFP